MSGNGYEWTTETAESFTPCVYRGGYGGDTSAHTSDRVSDTESNNGSSTTFRPILYLNTK